MARSRRGAGPVFYFNFRSPYAWLAHHDLTHCHPDVADRVEWRPWWEPDVGMERALNEAGGSFAYVPMSREKHLYILRDVGRLVRDRGLTVTWPVDREPHWEVPHLAYFVARERGRGRAYVDRVYRARWHEGRDICARETIAEIGRELGLPADRMRSAADDAKLRAGEGHRALLALSEDGAFGVPFFTLGYDKFWGVDRLPLFVESVRSRIGSEQFDAREPSTAGEVVATRSGDQGHAGGCG